jgi:opacity protein-like surface antigen
MTKIAVVIAGIAALIGTRALAADMLVKAPPPAPPASVYTWTGFYVGVNAGGSIGRDPTTQSKVPGPLHFENNFILSPAGFIGGGQIGYNYQFAPNWVVGVEGDFQGASQSDSSCVLDCGGPGFFGWTVETTQKTAVVCDGKGATGLHRW